MATSNEPEPDIAEQLRRIVTSWVTRSAPRIRDEMCAAKLEITLQAPGGDDAGRLVLDYTIDETVIGDRGSGVVTGLRFDPIPAPVVDITHCAVAGCRAKCTTTNLESEGWLNTMSAGWLCIACRPL